MTQLQRPSPGFLDLSLSGLLGRFAAEDAQLDGGPAAALAAAMGAALVAAAARQSRDSWVGANGVAAQATALESRCVGLAQADANAFADAVAALERGSELEKPLTDVVTILIELGETAADVASLAALTVECCDGMARGNAVAAAHLAEGAARVAATLVEVNLTVGPGDERLAQARRSVDAATQAARQAAEGSR